MPQFSRNFPVDDLKNWDAAHPGNTVRVLFDHWCLPGQTGSENSSLRIGLRGGYLNFYIKGQSVAKLSFSRKEPRLELAQAYYCGIEKARRGKLPLGKAAPLDGETLAEPKTAKRVKGWIKTAETYASAEKRFVDDLLAANPGIIDVEMALPASDIPGGVRVAPRMDIVIAQEVQDGSISVAFWEAKCANNKEVRAKGERPHVMTQVDNYEKWMEQKGRIDEVQEAYKANATHLLELHQVFRKDDYHPCRRIWQALADTEVPVIIRKPGLVIGNYWPGGSPDESGSQTMQRCAASFEANGHREKLQRAGLTVHEIGPDHAGLTLPVLTA